MSWPSPSLTALLSMPLTTAFPLLVTGGVVARATWLRVRLAPLRRVSSGWSPELPRPVAELDITSGEEFALVAVDGAVVSGHVRRAARGHARGSGLQVLDLVPANLPVERALDLARHTDLRRHRTDPLVAGRGAGFAVLATRELLTRANVRPGTLDPGALGAVTVRLRQYAERAGLAVVPCPATPRRPACRGRRAWLRGLGVPVPRTVARSAAGWLAVLAAVWAGAWGGSPWGWAALAAYCAAPYLVFAGTPLKPRDLHRAALLRPLLAPWNWWQTLTDEPTPWERRRARREQAARDRYREEYRRGVERFLEPRRPDCPWCGSRSLTVQVTSGDVLQAKPGRFTLERCGDCRHVFQNPRLTPEGMEFYYRDVYDGLGAETAERALAAQRPFHAARAALVAAHATPRTWLDVGTGLGHFGRVARTVLPDTAFDGLDVGSGVRKGARRGWLRHGYRGRFADLAEDLAGRYDVISMHHYLEHTPDPLAELDVAAKTLRPGGHLLVEMPDPDSRLGRRLGRFWLPWMQPQHLHLVPIGNLVQALELRGFRIVARQRRAAHQRYDLTLAAVVALTAFAPPPDRPWAPGPPTARDRLRRAVALAAAGPLLAAARLADRVLVPLVPGASNAYRVLARKAEG
ncbi:class I SAM-dependent methyltransferase [Actinomadura namibiensis]|uniref:SAM-dependent methyltransferase n=1 Tax=Actinomadura namibiensis TaxID=182080 RepID=A0A7W3LPG7_ACTNM|nr:class I SAM-dependent methyltransferase [Actinomadura namibiensis]MBA8951874.1 SAM-dependent methyltransferase [Actinomadura namibiensis]